MRSSCQTRALIRYECGQGSRPKRRPCRMAGGKRPVSRPAGCKRIKAEFGYDSRIGLPPCDRAPSGVWGTMGNQVMVDVWGAVCVYGRKGA
ncbi:hypothetical protein [Desulfosporosinus sp.]|uniref:hypothetical protein n=1 Tax=Desulfosporosinus sp. TaxID=157907 RepID=UPI0025C178B1|nr:hypothetical protein [Desulfosporosinus sp.]MBC2721346.1 hypothetical protein [Desulfosporosinus sp.]MBC2728800.1 hypothetical protein [Desulfosporosinus sp.]